jgi:hypothetical protein
MSEDRRSIRQISRASVYSWGDMRIVETADTFTPSDHFIWFVSPDDFRPVVNYF